MGLEYVELVMGVEERFGVRITNATAERFRTAGDLYFYILGRVERFKEQRCRGAAVFSQVRAALMNVLEVERRCVRPRAPLAELLGAQRPSRVWPKVQERFEFGLPELRNPGWVWPLAALVLVGAVGIWVAYSAVTACILSMAALLLLGLVFHWAWGHARLPASCNTVGDLVRTIVAKLPADADVEPAAVWDALRAIIAEACSVSRDEIRRDSRLVEDLMVG